jgi:hypothetical protein
MMSLPSASQLLQVIHDALAVGMVLNFDPFESVGLEGELRESVLCFVAKGAVGFGEDGDFVVADGGVDEL